MVGWLVGWLVAQSLIDCTTCRCLLLAAAAAAAVVVFPFVGFRSTPLLFVRLVLTNLFAVCRFSAALHLVSDCFRTLVRLRQDA